MNIQIAHFACERCIVNDRWMYDTPSGLMRVYFIHSGEGWIYNYREKHRLRPHKLYLFTQYSDFRTLEATNLDHSFFDFHANYALKPECFLEFDESDFPFINFETLAFMLHSKSVYENSLRSLLITILSYIDESQGLPLIANETVLRSIELIQAQSATVSTSQLAEMLCINESHYIRIFKKQLGITPMQYIRSCKIATGIACLQNGMNVAEASEKCGYSSSVAFTQAVKSETGVLPSHFFKKKK